MNKLKITALFILFFLYFGNPKQEVDSAQDNNNVIKNLQEIKVDYNQKVFSQGERENIVRLVTESYVDSMRQKHSDYISLETPFYILLKKNYPDIQKREEERGISLGNIVKFLNSKSENKAIINSVLVKNTSRKCL